jgi:signal peptidase I
METDIASPVSRKPAAGPEVRGLGGTLFLVFLVALGMKFFLFDFMIAEGRSMLPAIRPGTILLVNRAAYGFKLPWARQYLVRWAEPAVGDVIVFYTPQGNTAVKRCVEITENQKIIALGDNDLESFDSRSYGPIPVDNILGKALGIK